MNNKQQETSLFIYNTNYKPDRCYLRQWLSDGKAVSVGETYTYRPEDVGKRVSSQLVPIVDIRKKTIIKRNASMRGKRKLFTYSFKYKD